MSECFVTEKQDKIAVVYNPRSIEVMKRIAIPWNKDHDFTLTDGNGNKIIADLVPISWGKQRIPERTANTTHEVVFVIRIPPVGFTTVFLERKKNKNPRTKFARELIFIINHSPSKDSGSRCCSMALVE